jgi:hypothetical protein
MQARRASRSGGRLKHAGDPFRLPTPGLLSLLTPASWRLRCQAQVPPMRRPPGPSPRVVLLRPCATRSSPPPRSARTLRGVRPPPCSSPLCGLRRSRGYRAFRALSCRQAPTEATPPMPLQNPRHPHNPCFAGVAFVVAIHAAAVGGPSLGLDPPSRMQSRLHLFHPSRIRTIPPVRGRGCVESGAHPIRF